MKFVLNVLIFLEKEREKMLRLQHSNRETADENSSGKFEFDKV